MDGLPFKYFYKEINHFAPMGFMTERERSIDSVEFLFSCLLNSSEYQCWNCFLKYSFADIFRLMSNGCSLSMQSRYNNNSNVGCIKKSKNFFSTLPFEPIKYYKCWLIFRKRKINPFLCNLRKKDVFNIIFCSCLIGPVILGVCNVPTGKENLGRYFFVVPEYMTWGGRKSPVIVLANTAVICLLSFIPAISTQLAPSFSIVHILTNK